MIYYDKYVQQLIEKGVEEKKAKYIANKICNQIRKQSFCVGSLYIEGKDFKIGSKTNECGQLIKQSFTTKDLDNIYFQFYFY